MRTMEDKWNAGPFIPPRADCGPGMSLFSTVGSTGMTHFYFVTLFIVAASLGSLNERKSQICLPTFSSADFQLNHYSYYITLCYLSSRNRSTLFSAYFTIRNHVRTTAFYRQGICSVFSLISCNLLRHEVVNGKSSMLAYSKLSNTTQYIKLGYYGCTAGCR